MEEKIISGKKNGMLMLILIILAFIIGYGFIVFGIAVSPFAVLTE